MYVLMYHGGPQAHDIAQEMPVVVYSRLYRFWLYAVVLRVYHPLPLLPITGQSVYLWGIAAIMTLK